MLQRRILVDIRRPEIALLRRRCLSAPAKKARASEQRNEESIFARAWASYSNALYRRPLATKATMAAVIFFTSDSAAQYITRDNDDRGESSGFVFNPTRALSGSVFGVVATAFLHVWWGFLEQAVGARLPVQQYRLANTAVKVVVDQGIGAPFYIYSYYVVTNFLQEMSAKRSDPQTTPQQVFQETTAKASSMLWPTMLRHWRLWPLVHSINFYFVPLHHRVLVQNLVLVGWSGYLSYLNNNAATLLTPKEEIEVVADEIEQAGNAKDSSSTAAADEGKQSQPTTK